MPPKHDDQVWSLTGTLKHWIYSPRGQLEGMLLDVEGFAVQFVIDPSDAAEVQNLKPGQKLTVEGSPQDDSPKHAAQHEVYKLHRLTAPVAANKAMPREFSGKIVRFNYARHGQANGFVLSTGDFIHTRPHGFEQLGLNVGDKVTATGEARPLFNGQGQVVEATIVNQQPIE